ncbi:hypothetical protein [Novosphingobium aquae]|uniref:Uncharacterized protein n=1 Tax=Novosphingobium aquae TaxID=3133435 RepID=A0ABU8S4N1_9SPHN
MKTRLAFIALAAAVQPASANQILSAEAYFAEVLVNRPNWSIRSDSVEVQTSDWQRVSWLSYGAVDVKTQNCATRIEATAALYVVKGEAKFPPFGRNQLQQLERQAGRSAPPFLIDWRGASVYWNLSVDGSVGTGGDPLIRIKKAGKPTISLVKSPASTDSAHMVRAIQRIAGICGGKVVRVL